ncbi:MAG: HAD-IA family hydrolase, partial [Solirubrobacterales bacterium]
MAPPTALLIDFGGVLTSSVSASQEAFCRAEGLSAGAFGELLAGEGEVGRLAPRLEAGEIEDAELEAAIALGLGGTVAAEGLIGRLFAGLELDRAMIAAVERLRAAGVRVVIVSNSYGFSAYRWDLAELADAHLLSGAVGVAKPAPGIFELGLAEAGVEAAEAVFVDDVEVNVEAARGLGMEGILHREAALTVPRLERAFGIGLRGAGARSRPRALDDRFHDQAH